MNLFVYSLCNIRRRMFLSLLTTLSIAATVAFIVLFSLFRIGVEQGAEKGYGPFDVVVGAAGSETQLVLNTFYHIGAPTGNIPLSIVEQVRRDPGVDRAFAFTTGDRMNGFPVVGIDPEYFPVRYGGRTLSAGQLYAKTGEAVLGWQAAKESGLRPGDTFTGSHGLVEGGEASYDEDAAGESGHAGEEEHHESFRYTVTGILPRLNTPDDRAVFTTVDYAWAVHRLEGTDREITAVLVKPSSLLGAHALKEELADGSAGVQAVYTSKAVSDVVNTVDQGSRLVGLITGLCVVLASITVLLSLIAAAGERTKDAGLLRLLGKPKGYVWLTVVSEGLILTGIGLIGGLLLGHLAAFLIRETVFAKTGIQLNPWQWTPDQSKLVLGTLVIGLLASLLPAFRLYRLQPLALFSRANLLLLVIGIPLLLSACGRERSDVPAASAGSFLSAVSSPVVYTEEYSPGSPSPAGSAPAPTPDTREASTATPGQEAASFASSSPAAAPSSPLPSVKSNSASAGNAAASGQSAQPPSKKDQPIADKEKNPPTASPSPNAGTVASAPPGKKPSSTAAPAAPAAPKPDKATDGPLEIGWSDFFDGTDQTRPSERFWDLSEGRSTVTIKGFMGEVLSFEKHWFLLIPAPGAECPFDNGDETYWNKIMIVFVQDDQKLRYKSGPLEITGRLDVGIKVDESGYKTMFRLYDASFKEVTE